MKKLKEISEKKLFKITKKIINIFLVIFIIAFVGVVYLQSFSDNKLAVFNYRMFTVVSESMAPKYGIGDVLFAKEVEPSKIKVGDDISYEGRQGDLKGKVVTHRVTKVNQDENGEYIFRAKGIANLIEDPAIRQEQIFGVIVHKAFFLSLIYKMIATNIGFYLCIIIPLMFVVGSEILATLINREEKRRVKSE